MEVIENPAGVGLYIPWIIAVFFYIEAGRRTWQNMFLALPENSNEPLALAVKANAVPLWVLVVWYVFWGLIMLGIALSSKALALTRRTA